MRHHACSIGLNFWNPFTRRARTPSRQMHIRLATRLSSVSFFLYISEHFLVNILMIFCTIFCAFGCFTINILMSFRVVPASLQGDIALPVAAFCGILSLFCHCSRPAELASIPTAPPAASCRMSRFVTGRTVHVCVSLPGSSVCSCSSHLRKKTARGVAQHSLGSIPSA